MKKVLIHIVAYVAACLILVSIICFRTKEMREYVEIGDCYVAGVSEKPAMGKTYILTINKTTTLNIQQSQTVNMENANMGDNMRVVIVRDADQVLQCVVRVEDK